MMPLQRRQMFNQRERARFNNRREKEVQNQAEERHFCLDDEENPKRMFILKLHASKINCPEVILSTK